ncbi:MAG: hypothetical protein GY832_24805 [Chloroflexi bacterium]|nr:hypothetical protein [Chloroflexota bacterium]
MDVPLKNSKEPPDYLSYLLRLWQVSDGKTAWRASLESSYTGERKGFANLDDLFDFLRTQISAQTGGELDQDHTAK